MAAGVLLATPALAQNVSVTTDQAAGPAKAGDKVHVCAVADAGVANVAGWKLTFTYPAGWTVTPTDPADPDTAFTAGPAITAGSQIAVNNQQDKNTLIVGAVSTKNAPAGGGQVGCFDLVSAADSQSGPVAVAVEANDKDANTVNVSSAGGTIQGASPTQTTTTAGTTTGETTTTAGTTTGETTTTAGTTTGETTTTAGTTTGETTTTAGTTTGETTTTAGTTTGETTTTAGTTTGETTTTAGTTTVGGACPDIPGTSGQIDITDVTAAAGDTITVTITVANDVLNIAGAKLTLSYDANVLSFTTPASGEPGDAITLGDVAVTPQVAVNAGTAGTLIIGLVSTKNSTKGGTLLTFPLTVKAGIAPTRTEIKLAAELNNANADTVNATVGNGVVTIGDCSGATTTTAGTTTGETTTTAGTTTAGTTTAGTTTAGTTTVGTRVPGDVNGDGKVDVSDVRDAIKVLFGVITDPAAKAAADVNGDGNVDLVDIRILLQAVVKGTPLPGTTAGTTTAGTTTAGTTTGETTTTAGTTTAGTTTGETTTTAGTTTAGTTTGETTTTAGTTTGETTTTAGTTTAGTTTGETTTTAGTTTAGTTTGETTTTAGTTTSGTTTGGGGVSIGALSAATGQTIQVPINFSSDLINVAGAKFTITYDPAVFTFTTPASGDPGDAVTLGSVLITPQVAVNANTPGTIIIGLVSTKNSTAGGQVLTLPLTVAANATATTSTITLDAELNDRDANTVAASVVKDNVVTITAG